MFLASITVVCANIDVNDSYLICGMGRCQCYLFEINFIYSRCTGVESSLNTRASASVCQSLLDEDCLSADRRRRWISQPLMASSTMPMAAVSMR